jgi:hypothetical protein
MIRSLLSRLRRNPVIVGVSALAVVLAATLALRGTVADHGTSVVLAAEPAYGTPLDDTGMQHWQIEAPEPVPEPEPEVVTPVVQPTPNVDWNALAVGVSDVRMSQNVSLSVHADVDGALSSAQRQALISQAEAEAAGAGAGRLPGFVGAVVARGTPGGGGDCAPTAW